MKTKLNSSVAGMVFAPMWRTQDSEPEKSTVRALSEMIRIGVTRVVLVYDRRSPVGGVISQRSEAAMSPIFSDAGGELLIVEASEPDTGADWRAGLVRAFAAWEADAVLNLPGDLDPESCDMKRLRTNLRLMVAKSAPSALVLGDSESVGPSGKPERFKTEFDSLTRHSVVPLFPELADPLMNLGVSKLRTEFFSVGRDIWNAFDADPQYFPAAADMTYQLVRFVLESNANGLPYHVVRVDLGKLHDDDSRRRALGQFHQLVRIQFATVQDRVLHEYRRARDAGDDERDLLARYSRMCWDIESSFGELVHGLNTNARSLDDGYVTNPKLSGPRHFAPFPGLTVLFDQPGLVEFLGDTRLIKTSAAEPRIPFYESLREATSELIGVLEPGGFLPLPADSWHVTAADIAGCYSLEKVPSANRATFDRWLRRLPWAAWNGFPPVESLQFSGDQRITFRFTELKIFNKAMVLVARLEPADEASCKALAVVKAYRGDLDQAWADWRDPSTEYSPHISVGYWVNADCVASAAAQVATASKQVCEAMKGGTVSFSSASLHAFTDMITFFKLPKQPRG